MKTPDSDGSSDPIAANSQLPTSRLSVGSPLSSNTTTSATTVTPTGWIGWSWIAGMIVGIGFGWLLAYLAMLPFFLGLFFFMVLGLVTGAIMFRFGSRAALPATPWLWLIGSSVAATMLITCLWVEYRDLSSMKKSSVGGVVRKSYDVSFTVAERANLEQQVRDHVASFLKRSSPPGGFIGYLKWAATNGTMEVPRFAKATADSEATSLHKASAASSTAAHSFVISYELPQRQWKWLFRVVVSALLLEGSIMSQMLALQPKKLGSQATAMA